MQSPFISRGHGQFYTQVRMSRTASGGLVTAARFSFTLPRLARATTLKTSSHGHTDTVSRSQTGAPLQRDRSSVSSTSSIAFEVRRASGPRPIHGTGSSPTRGRSQHRSRTAERNSSSMFPMISFLRSSDHAQPASILESRRSNKLEARCESVYSSRCTITDCRQTFPLIRPNRSSCWRSDHLPLGRLRAMANHRRVAGRRAVLLPRRSHHTTNEC